MVAANQLQLVIVTPETTLLDEPVRTLQFPLYDGQIGILPGRAPLVGRLGSGELSAQTNDKKLSYFIDGGFVQVKGGVVSILTSRAVPTAKLDAKAAQAELDELSRKVAVGDEAAAAHARDQERARKMLNLARRGR